MTAPTTHKFAIACGTGGTLVEVTDWVVFNEGDVTYRYGRTDQFTDVAPGVFAFTLDNRDGRFTPGNAATALDVPLVEGMAVCWQLNDRLVQGTIRGFQVVFAENVPEGARVRVTCVDDLLGDAARDSSPMAQGLAAGAPLGGADVVFLFDDRGPLAHHTGYTTVPVPDWGFGAAAEFGVEGPPGGPDTQVELTAAAATSVTSALTDSRIKVLSNNYFGPATRLGVSFIVTPMNLTSYFDFRADWFSGFRIGIQNEWLVWYTPAGSYAQVMQISPGVPYAVSIHLSSGVRYLRVNGVDRATSALTPTFVQEPPQIIIGDAAYGESAVRLSSLICGYSPVPSGGTFDPIELGFGFDGATAETRAEGIAASLGITLTTTTLPTELLGAIEPGTRLDQLNSLARTIGGSLYCSTTGTLTSPTTTLNITGAIRPPTPAETYSTTNDIHRYTFARDTTNTVSAVTVTGPNDRVTVNYGAATNLQLRSRVGSANSSQNVEWQKTAHLTFWGQDRLNRAYDETMTVTDVTVDARSTNRWDDLLDATLGQRERISDLPATQLGFDTWDGWLIGVSERHNNERNEFTHYYQPALPATAIFDTDRFAGGTTLTLSAGINSSVTSISVATSAVKLTTTEVPFNITIDDEILTVTACTSATPQVLTVTRGAAGTTAASHSSSAVVELTTPALFAY